MKSLTEHGILDLIEILLKISDNKTLIIDEIDRCLHPAITTRIIELFLKIAEERNTQLIVTSHESRLLAALKYLETMRYALL